MRGRRVSDQAHRSRFGPAEARQSAPGMKWLHAVLWLAGLMVAGGLLPMGYVLLRQLRERRVRKEAQRRMLAAEAAIGGSMQGDQRTAVQVLSEFDPDTLD